MSQCPSEAEFEEAARGVLPRSALSALETHARGCAPCALRLHLAESRAGGVTAPVSGVAPLPGEEEPAKPGDRLGRYLVLGKLGQGGMAIVYKAFDAELDRNVAVKVMLPSGIGRTPDADTRGRFLREAQAMARVSHPNVIEVYDVGSVNDQAFIAMKLVDGATLSAWISEKPRGWREVVSIYAKAGQGLAAAHRAGLVHRDFKPSNVLVGKDGQVYVTDFGLARMASAIDEAEKAKPDVASLAPTGMLSHELTRAGSVVGTEGFIAPERYGGASPDASADQFSFCVALYRGLYGQAPFERGAVLRVSREVTAPESPSPGTDALRKYLREQPKDSDVPSWVHRVVVRGLRSSPSERFASMDALLDALARDPGSVRRRWLAGAAAVLVLAGVGAAWRATVLQQRTLCAGEDQALAGAWDDSVRAAGERAFLATQLPYAPEAWHNVSGTLSAYAKSWVEMKTSACTATRIRGEQSDEVLSLRMICLDQRLEELRALTAVLQRADAKTVEKSSQAAASLADIGRCARVASLEEVLRAPEDPAKKAKLADVRRLLAEAKALGNTGDLPHGLTKATEAAALADALQYSPLQGEAHLALGSLLSESGKPPDAKAALLEAYAKADEGRDDLTRAGAAVKMVWVLGLFEERFADAGVWADLAHAILTRVGGARELELLLLNEENGVLYAQGKREQLVAKQQALVELQERYLGTDNVYTIVAIMNLGAAHESNGDLDEGAAAMLRAQRLYEKNFGPRYYRTGELLNNRAVILLEQGKAREASELAKRALDILLPIRGPTHAVTLNVRDTVAEATLALGDVDGAIALYEDNQAKSAAIPKDGEKVGTFVADLARAYRAKGDVRRAMKSLSEAIQLREQHAGDPQPVMVLLLSGLGECSLDLHQPREAIPPLERALKLAAQLKVAPQWIARAKYALARALWEGNGDRARARALAEDALATFTHGNMKERPEVVAWLAGHTN